MFKTFIEFFQVESLPIPSGFFDHNPNLESVSLSFNNMSKLPYQLFQNLSQLKILDFSRNRLTTLPIHSAPLMMQLNLSRNSFRQLPDEIFQNFPKLLTLDLSENQFDNLSDNLFKNNPDLETLIWENDACHLANGSRHFPRHLLVKNKSLKTFLFSTKIQSGSFLCREVTFSVNLFRNQNSLRNLKISNAPLKRTDLGKNNYRS
jgi:Leucine-rich repeat (LRR) protein